MIEWVLWCWIRFDTAKCGPSSPYSVVFTRHQVNGFPESHLFRWNRDVTGGDNPPPTFGCARENSGPSSRVFWGGEVGIDVSFCRSRAANARRPVSACGGHLDMYRDPRSVPSHPCVSSLRSNLDPTIDECYLNWVVLTFPAVLLGV